MPLYQCRFCDYHTIYKNTYYYHLYTHNTPDNVCKLSEDELKLCDFYHSKKIQYFLNYRQNNKDIISQRDKEYRLRKKLEKEEANILDVNDSD